jgi:type VI protein secretion system component VasK
MVLAADYPFLDVLWTLIVFFLWISWLMLLFHVIGDVFRRRDMSGGSKTLWLLVLLFVPFLGVFVYLIANGDGMAQRSAEQVTAAQEAAASAGAAGEIERAKGLLDSGAIDQQEYDAIKAKALA